LGHSNVGEKRSNEAEGRRNPLTLRIKKMSRFLLPPLCSPGKTVSPKGKIKKKKRKRKSHEG